MEALNFKYGKHWHTISSCFAFWRSINFEGFTYFLILSRLFQDKVQLNQLDPNFKFSLHLTRAKCQKLTKSGANFVNTLVIIINCAYFLASATTSVISFLTAFNFFCNFFGSLIYKYLYIAYKNILSAVFVWKTLSMAYKYKLVFNIYII